MTILDKVSRKLVEIERKEKGRNLQTTMLIVDSKSIQKCQYSTRKRI